MDSLQIRPRTEEDDAAIVAIVNRINAPLPAVDVDEMRLELRMVPDRAHFEILVAEIAGEVVAQGRVYTMFWTGENSCIIDVGVAPEWRGRGIGDTLFLRLLKMAQEWEPGRLYARVREGDEVGLAFARKRGFAETGHATRFSRLDVTRSNFEGYEGLADRLAAEGIRVTTLAELGDAEGTMRALYEVSNRTAQDEPTPAGNNQPYDEWRHGLATVPGISLASIWVALHGDEIIGLSMVRRVGEDSGFHFGMGVDRAYRGKGVARLIKQRQIEWARENGVRYLDTGNDSANPRMYEINARLGYEPLPASLMLVREPA